MKNPLALVFALLTAAPVTAVDAKDEMKKLEGTWTVTAAEIGGEKADVAKIGIDAVAIKDGRMALSSQGKEVVSYPIRIDPSKKPKHMDWTNEQQKSTLPTIYALEGDELRLCFPMLRKKGSKEPLDIKRPENFDTKGKAIMALTAKRAKG